MGLLTDLIAELKATIIAAVDLPDAPSGSLNFLTTIQGTKKNFVEQVAKGRIVLPCVVLGIGDFKEAPASDGGMNTVGYRCAPITVHYISQWAGTNGVQDTSYDQIYNVKNAIDSRPSTFTTFFRIEEGVILSDVDSPVNSSLLASSEVQIVSSALEYMPGLRVQLY